MMVKLHLGCGPNYLEGWINIDIDPVVKSDLLFDLREEFPFPDSYVDFIYNEHFIEHLTYNEGLLFLQECNRILQPRGILRISTPDLEYVTFVYIAGHYDVYQDIGIGLESETKCKFLNRSMRDWGHQYLYDLPELIDILHKSSFSLVKNVSWGESIYPELCKVERRPYHYELIVEAMK
jgi:predicted SAM-dependent methyltransferase